MKIIESKPNLDIDLPGMSADATFTVYNKNTKKYEKAEYIKNTGLPSSNHILIYYGLTGQGKTSNMCSLVTSKKPGSKVYRGVFDKIYICASYTSMRSITGDPFKSIPEDQYYETFDEQFLRDVTQRVHDNALDDLNSLIIIDDAVSRLKRLADPLSNLLLTHRHLKTSIHILAQDIVQVPLSIRANLTGGFFFKQSNNKRIQLLREEYLSFLNPIQYKKFEAYVWQKKGDCLYVSFRLPYRYHRISDLKVRELTFENLEDL
jgi:hypothetical protein